jgi:exodeoxyribonuclease VII small subunit
MHVSKKTSSKKTPEPSETPKSFETAMAELEALVTRMEKGDQSLEQSLQDFEQGVTLTRICQQALSEAEQKVQILTQSRNGESLQPFEPEESDA